MPMDLDLSDVASKTRDKIAPMIDPVRIKQHPGNVREYAEERMEESGKVVLLNIFDGESGRLTEATPFPTIYPILHVLAKDLTSNFDGNPVMDIISSIYNGIHGESGNNKLVASGGLFVVRVDGFSYVTRYNKVDVLRYGVVLECRPK